MSIRILGIDPGVERIGWGVIEKKSQKTAAVAWGRIQTSARNTLAERIVSAMDDLDRIITQYKPDALGVEELFFANNMKTAMSVSHMRGAILLTGAKHHLPIHEYTPLEVKQTLTGFGRAEKRQIQAMIKALFGVALPPSQDDAADALAIAYTAMVNTKHEARSTK